jgi:hypothetical protein
VQGSLLWGEFLPSRSRSRNISFKIVTDDETRIQHWDLDTKQQSTTPKQFWLDFMSHETTISGDVYIAVLQTLNAAITNNLLI